MNQIIIVGYVVKVPELKETPNGIIYTNVLIDVKRSFKDADGKYQYDRIKVKLYKSIAEILVNNSVDNSLVGVKGRLQVDSFNDSTRKDVYIVAEKVTLLDRKGDKS